VWQRGVFFSGKGEFRKATLWRKTARQSRSVTSTDVASACRIAAGAVGYDIVVCFLEIDNSHGNGLLLDVGYYPIFLTTADLIVGNEDDEPQESHLSHRMECIDLLAGRSN
jgi:hypothetical protein